MLNRIRNLMRSLSGSSQGRSGVDAFDPNTFVFPESMIAEGRANPGGWVYLIDGVSNPDGEIPPERIFGAFKVDANGS